MLGLFNKRYVISKKQASKLLDITSYYVYLEVLNNYEYWLLQSKKILKENNDITYFIEELSKKIMQDEYNTVRGLLPIRKTKDISLLDVYTYDSIKDANYKLVATIIYLNIISKK